MALKSTLVSLQSKVSRKLAKNLIVIDIVIIMTEELTHFTEKGDAQMVDISEKDITHRVAIARGSIAMSDSAFKQIVQGNNKKGDVLAVARLAGIMGAKKTADLIPLCHPLPLTHISMDFDIEEQGIVHCEVKVETRHRTGVEMEALTALNITLLTIYDMCKAVDKSMQMSDIRLIHKSGGKSSFNQ